MKQSVDVGFLAFIGALIALVLVPLVIISYGYLPSDDALRHSAKVVSEKPWNEILVLENPEIIDPHPGWHTILGWFRSLTGADVDGILVFAVLVLALLCIVPPLFKAKYPESWVMAFLAVCVLNGTYLRRLMFGRPFLFSVFVLIMVCLNWEKLKVKKPPFGDYLLFTILFAAACWIHGNWYLFLVIIPCFFLAGEHKAGTRLLICFAAGTILGASLTGHPFRFMFQTLSHALSSMDLSVPKRLLVSEFQPSNLDVVMFFAMLILLIGKKAFTGKVDRGSVVSPLSFIILICGVLGIVSIRFWMDWGVPVVGIWLMLEIDKILDSGVSYKGRIRMFTAAGVLPFMLIASTADINSRWTSALTKEYITRDIEGIEEWLPESGGTVYSASMNVFYDMFYKNPDADWRYILGFEPTMMPKEDLEILRKIWWNHGAVEGYAPWAAKMGPEDRIVIRGTKSSPPGLKGLEWFYAATNIWIGKKIE